MRPGGGKGKGSQYERDVGYKLSLWLSKGERKDILCRTVGSGAQFTASCSRDQLRGIPGDLRSQHELGNLFCEKYVIEAKFWKDLELHKFLNGEGDLYGALEKVSKEGKDLNKSWMLICKQNHRKDVIISPALLDFVLCCMCPGHLLFNARCGMSLLDDFLKLITPDQVLTGIKAQQGQNRY